VRPIGFLSLQGLREGRMSRVREGSAAPPHTYPTPYPCPVPYKVGKDVGVEQIAH
jgi:hypothetical protein